MFVAFTLADSGTSSAVISQNFLVFEIVSGFLFSFLLFWLDCFAVSGVSKCDFSRFFQDFFFFRIFQVLVSSPTCADSS